MRGSARYIKNMGRTELVCAEVGVRSGENAVAMLGGLPIKKITLVDNYESYFDGNRTIFADEQSIYYEQMLAAVSPYAEQVEVIKEKSEFACLKFASGSLDFVYIDGNHSFGYVKKDLLAWWPLLKSNGILGGHDFWFPAVRMALREFMSDPDNHIMVFNDSDWAILKK